MSTPSAPTISPGVTNTLTVPDAILTKLTGGTTYSYKIVNRDRLGGLTLPSSATTLKTGPATLGENQLSISTATLLGNTLTVVMSATENLQTNELVHIVGMSNESLRGWYNISSIPNGTTFVINNVPVYSASGINTRGGTLTYYTGNQLSWKNSGPNIWETIICASRPADSGSYHVIGLSYPVNAVPVPYGSNTTFHRLGGNAHIKAEPSAIHLRFNLHGGVGNKRLSFDYDHKYLGAYNHVSGVCFANFVWTNSSDSMTLRPESEQHLRR